MPLELQLSRRAYTDVDQHVLFIRERSDRETPERWRSALFRRLLKLLANPDVWPLADEQNLAEAGVREFLFRRWRFVYRVLFSREGEIVYVHRIRSAAQDAVDLDEL